MLVFKVDFDKAFDSLNWGFLDSVLMQMNFSDKWRRWIRGCLSSGRASVLINGSPSLEFQIKKGVRQGDPMAPFLFVLAMEGLTVSLKEACSQFIFNGISLSEEGPGISHLMYADDVTFVGEWSESNFLNLNRILRCFFIASGLKVNLSKSKVFGVGVEHEELSRLAGILNCEPAAFPSTFLGLPIGANMSLCRNWKTVIDKFQSKLSKWKSSMLSFGGRLTLVNSVLSSLPLYFFSLFKAPKKIISTLESIRRNFLWGSYGRSRKIHWIAWEDLTKPKLFGGIGINSLSEMNVALLTKWVWRLKSQPDSLWARCIKSIHRLSGIDGMPIARRSIPGVWLSISEVVKELEGWNCHLDDYLIRKMGNGDNTCFWKDRWLMNAPLKDIFPRLYAIESRKNCFVLDRLGEMGQQEHKWEWKRNIRKGMESKEMEELKDLIKDISLTNVADSWKWIISFNNVFSVQSLRREMARLKWNSNEDKFAWLHEVPLNINCFVWRFLRNRIAVTDNLIIRGVRLTSTTCACCGSNVDSLQHVFFDCRWAKDLWDKVWRWCSISSVVPADLTSFRKNLSHKCMEKKSKKLKTGIMYAVVWYIWKARNEAIFRKIIPKVQKVFDDIQVNVFNWFKFRGKKRIEWNEWLCNTVI